LVQVWVADITYIRLEEEFVFLAVILDAYSKRVIGWHLDDGLDDSLTLAALRIALRERTVRPGLVRSGGFGGLGLRGHSGGVAGLGVWSEPGVAGGGEHDAAAARRVERGESAGERQRRGDAHGAPDCDLTPADQFRSSQRHGCRAG
jgi:hypothetical protein